MNDFSGGSSELDDIANGLAGVASLLDDIAEKKKVDKVTDPDYGSSLNPTRKMHLGDAVATAKIARVQLRRLIDRVEAESEERMTR